MHAARLRCGGRLRSQLVHQQVLDEPVSIPSDTLGPFEELETLYASDPELLGRLHLEQGLLHHLLSQDKLAVSILFVQGGVRDSNTS